MSGSLLSMQSAPSPPVGFGTAQSTRPLASKPHLWSSGPSVAEVGLVCADELAAVVDEGRDVRLVCGASFRWVSSSTLTYVSKKMPRPSKVLVAYVCPAIPCGLKTSAAGASHLRAANMEVKLHFPAVRKVERRSRPDPSVSVARAGKHEHVCVDTRTGGQQTGWGKEGVLEPDAKHTLCGAAGVSDR